MPPATAFSSLRVSSVVAALLLLAVLPGLGARGFWFPDEPDVAEPVLTMLRSGDWTVPRHNEQPWLDYPPLTYWAAAATARLCGSEAPVVLRLPVALAAALLVGCTAYATVAVGGLRAGLMAGVVLATVPQFLFQAANLHPDMLFALTQGLGIAVYAWSWVGHQGRSGWRCWLGRSAGFACLGLAVLAKGPLGLLLPGLVLGLWHVCRREWAGLLALAPLSLVALAVCLPWYASADAALEAGTVWHEVKAQNLARFGDGVARGHLKPWYYYLVGTWAQWAPWSVLFPLALQEGWRRRQEPVLRLALIWVLTSLIFLSLAATKREVYLLPAYPALALLAGCALETVLAADSSPGWRWGGRALGTLLAVSGLVLPVVSRLIPGLMQPASLLMQVWLPLLLLSGVLVLGGVLLLCCSRQRLQPPAPLVLATTLALTAAVLGAGIAPKADIQRSYAPMGAWLREHSGALPIGYYLPGAERKRSGVRLADPAFQPLVDLADPSCLLAWAGQPGHLAVGYESAVRTAMCALPALEVLPQRTWRIGGRSFLVIGMAAGGTSP